MQVQDLAIPERLKQHYITSGIRDLYPPQAACIEKGLLSGENLLVAIPTASGKTLIAEMAMHRHISNGGKCLYIVPLKALASEKYDEFSNKGINVGISTGDLDRRDEGLGRNDVIVATSEKVDSLLRNSAHWIQDITLLVIDEIHLIDSPDRGPTLEMVIAKMRYRNPDMQIVGLSATIGNPKLLAGWLDAELVTSVWRPVDLRQGVFYSDSILFEGGSTRDVRQISKNYDDLNLCLDTIAEGGQCLVFVSSRRNAEAFAKRAASAIKQEDPNLVSCSTRLLSGATTEMVKTLATCVAKGAAFHHAGLSRNERSIVEEAFRKGWIKCISSTPTLAAGLNLPARRVIVRDYMRFSTGEGMQPIPVSEYRQMAGRAGRPRLDPYGEAVLIAKEADQVQELFAYYIEAAAEDVNSRLAEPSALYTHILSLVASGFAKTRDEISTFMNRSYYVFEHRQGRLMHRAVRTALDFLIDAEMLNEVGEHLQATELGSLVSRMYIDPRSASMIVTELRKVIEYTDIGLLQLICSTPDMPTLYVKNADLPALSRMIERDENALWLHIPDDEEAIESYYRAIKTAMLLFDWTDELSEEKICERYAIGPGDIYGMVESINWLLHATTQLARLFAPTIYPKISEYETCMKNGIRRELLPLIKIRGIGRVRARRLFNNGITSPEAIEQHKKEDLIRILGVGITDQILDQIHPKRKESSNRSNNKDAQVSGQATLLHFG